LTRSVEVIADDPPLDFQACLDDPPEADQPFVPCDQPHLYEQTGTLALIKNQQKYPTAGMRETEAERQCPADLPEGVTGASVTAAWDGPQYFETGREVAGACFFFRTDGAPLPGR
jgi:hypothetical protein